MTTVELLGQLRSLGVDVWTEGAQLRCRAPKGTLTAALEGELRRRKTELLEFLQSAREATGAPYIPLAARGGEGLPLSFGQHRLWFLDRMQPGNPAYNIFLPLALSGRLDAAALRQALSDVVRRHEVLRTCFPTRAGTPVQWIRPAAPADLPDDDLRLLPPARLHDALLNLARDEARESFDLANGPLYRARLVRLDETEHVLCWTMHHSIGDGWSLGVLVRDLAAYYNGACGTEPVRLPDLPIQYGDYAVWQQRWLAGPRLESLLEYWQRELPRDGRLDLPTDRPRSAAPASEGARHRFSLDRELRDRLVAFSRSQNVTLFMTLLAALFVLLARRSDQDHVVIGSPIANRTHPSTHPLVGFFVNTLVLGGDLSANPTFTTFLAQVKRMALGAYEHQDLPFERLVEATRQARDVRRNPIFDVMFVYQNLPLPQVTLSGLAVRPLEVESTLAKFDLVWDLFEADAEIVGRIQYRTDLYDGSTVARMAAEFHTLLHGVLADPQRRVRDLPLLDAAERRAVSALACGRIDADAAATRRAPLRCGVHDAFDAQAVRTPDAIAVVADGERLTYAQLRGRSHALARRLRAAGAGPEARVALWTNRRVETIVGILGIWTAGGVYVPIDPLWPRARVDLVLADATPRVAVVPQDVIASWDRRLPALVAVDGSENETAVASATSPASAAYVIYTSGSTGRPNGVVVTHDSAMNLVAALNEARGARHSGPLRVGVNGPWVFDTTIKQIVQLTGGHALHVLPEACRSDPAQFLDYMREHRIDVVDVTPSQARLLVAAGLLDDASLRSLVLLIGGEAIDPALWQALASAADRTCFNLYGPTECTVDATLSSVGSSTGGPTIGRPLLNVRTYVLDRRLHVCPIGVAGELWIAGAGVARGYLNAPALTAARFLPDPFVGEPGARMYRTGDRVRLRATGELEYLGRVDEALKIRGFRIEPQEIEAVLMRHPDVREAAIVGYERSPNDVRLIAYVTLRTGTRAPAADLRRFLQRHLPAHLVPSAYVTLAALPLTPNGKLDRRALPLPDLSQRDDATIAVAPRDAIEWQLAAIWAELLGLDTVGVTDDFFESGGHSLLAMLMLGRVKQQFGCEIPIATLFQGATVEQLATHIRRRASGAEDSPLVAIRTTGSRPPFFCVHPVGGHVLCYVDLAAAVGAEQPFYGLQAPQRTGGHEFSVEALAARYVAAIKTARPDGPYQLGGWSLGGVIAFEMARQLQTAGEEVAGLVLIDSHATHLSGPSALSEEILLRRFAADLLGREPAALRELAAPVQPDDATALFDELYARAMATGLLPQGSDATALRALFDLFRANLRAESHYRPAASFLHVVLLQAASSVSGAADVTFGWSRLATAGVERRVLPGDHYSLMRKPDVDAVAAELRRSLSAGARPTAMLAAENRA
jgi:amino acid adenylation domain-containing protein